MATNLALEDKLIDEARRIGKHKSKKEAVTAALKDYIRSRKRLEILDWIGKVEYYDDYDYKALRTRKPG
ncbi:MAG: type II toxin-antitoxin system VapB family antitoxin [Gammaproteobacteria bacterium]|nr:type II toxin-antitoxin system VapB family antitoxin [Gammaproteobacteria bacterium]